MLPNSINPNELEAQTEPAPTWPWHVCPIETTTLRDKKGCRVGSMVGTCNEYEQEENEYHAKRAALCVNALAGLTNEAIESGVLTDLIAAAKYALERTLSPQAVRMLRAAIEKATGEGK